MKQFRYIIQDELGIHARPAGLFAKEVKKYVSSVKIKKGEKEVSAEQLLMLMGLGVKKGDEVVVTIEGIDEEIVYNALLTFFQTNL